MKSFIFALALVAAASGFAIDSAHRPVVTDILGIESAHKPAVDQLLVGSHKPAMDMPLTATPVSVVSPVSIEHGSEAVISDASGNPLVQIIVNIESSSAPDAGFAPVDASIIPPVIAPIAEIAPVEAPVDIPSVSIPILEGLLPIDLPILPAPITLPILPAPITLPAIIDAAEINPADVLLPLPVVQEINPADLLLPMPVVDTINPVLLPLPIAVEEF